MLATDELVQMCRSGSRWAAVRMASTTTWSTCSCVIRTALAPSSASGAENEPGSITSVVPACSSSYARMAELTEPHASSSIPHIIYDEMHHLGQIDPTARACAGPAIHLAG